MERVKGKKNALSLSNTYLSEVARYQKRRWIERERKKENERETQRGTGNERER